MSFSKSLVRLIPEDDDIDLIEFMKFRQERDEISDDEIDYERAEEEERQGAVKVVNRKSL